MNSTPLSLLWTNLKEVKQALLNDRSETCAICNSSRCLGTEICPHCERDYFHPELGRCQHCGKLISKGHKLCMDCQEGKGPKGLEKVVAWGHYTGEWRDFIQSMKFKAQPYKLKRVVPILAKWAVEELPPPNFLVPVPMHPERLLERGFNQAEAIASLLQWELGVPVGDVLKRVNYTVPQVGLNRSARLHNLKGAFCITSKDFEPKIQGARIWIIDDVTTTGTTLEACALELKKIGAHEVYGLTLAAGLEKNTVQSNQTMV